MQQNRLSSVEMFRAGKWSKSSWQLLDPVKYHCAVSTSDSELVVIGGWDTNRIQRRVTRYNVFTGQVEHLEPLPVSLRLHACLYLDNMIYVSGGRTSGNKVVRNVWQYDGLKWTKLPPLREARSGHAMVALDDSLYVLGGALAQTDDTLVTVERLSKYRNQWEKVSPGIQLNFTYGSYMVIN